MSRRPGLAGFEAHTQSLQSFAALSNALNQTQIEALHSQLSQFRSALHKFASEHRETIRADPEFRRSFQQMCASIGVDPLAGPRKGGWWSEALGLGDWQHELGVQIVDICLNTRDRNGGIISVSELIRLLSKLRGVPTDGKGGKVKGMITVNDIKRSIKTLEPLGKGYQIVGPPDNLMVQSIIKEVDDDQTQALALAVKLGGSFTRDDMESQLNWTQARAGACIGNMVSSGTCWIDEYDGRTAYWVPSVVEWDD
ncbi:EAP30/Vps36 family-domain-containing protein [Cantharellus anzutake]|uniref:EAP30/Vps36 family-domain-containing protein n=1 Tax=Cantharellus anzutake TaxID=1750568 RepID=UPI001908A4D2|nr:EAP30/Vps36 family-domain-containing protein [Cantharellus anzutake]KAF8339045.1 EAP30/Vps36 family-domain-containing protein [Cantharellus anzutake]